MTPPEADRTGPQNPEAGTPPAVSVCPLATLQKRKDFLAAARARREVAKGLILQARQRKPDECAPDLMRVGYTCSKKVGNAVARNRAKRRLREAARQVLPTQGRPGWDYVLIGRAVETGQRPFTLLVGDLESALRRIHKPPRPRT